MIPLQAAIAAGIILLAFLCVALVIGTPILTMLYMKAYWKMSNQQEKITHNLPYYKDPLALAICIVLAFGSVLLGFYVGIVALDMIFVGDNMIIN